MTERWAPIPGYEGSYEVSDHGHVRSLDRRTTDGHMRRGRDRKLVPTRSGYLQVCLWRGNRWRRVTVHRLVLTAFVGDAPPGAETRHLDGNPANNTLANLCWGTPSENRRDTLRHGTHPMARKTHCAAGHLYDESNTYIYPNRVQRGCHACRRARAQRKSLARKAAA